MGDRSKTAVLSHLSLMYPALPRRHSHPEPPRTRQIPHHFSAWDSFLSRGCNVRISGRELRPQEKGDPSSCSVQAMLPGEGHSGGGRESMARTRKGLQRALCPRHLSCGAPLLAVAHLHTRSKPRMVSVPWPRQRGCPTSHYWGSSGCMATTCLC